MVCIVNDKELVYFIFKFDFVDKLGDFWFRIIFGFIDKCSGGFYIRFYIFRFFFLVRFG